MFRAILAIGLLFPSASFTKEALQDREVQKPLEVKGQTRNISLLMVNQNNKDKVKFVTPRRNFKEQILKTPY